MEKISNKSFTCKANGSSTVVEHSIADPEFKGLNPMNAQQQWPIQ